MQQFHSGPQVQTRPPSHIFSDLEAHGAINRADSRYFSYRARVAREDARRAFGEQSREAHERAARLHKDIVTSLARRDRYRRPGRAITETCFVSAATNDAEAYERNEPRLRVFAIMMLSATAVVIGLGSLGQAFRLASTLF